MQIKITPTYSEILPEVLARGWQVYLAREFKLGRIKKCWFFVVIAKDGHTLMHREIESLDKIVRVGTGWLLELL